MENELPIKLLIIGGENSGKTKFIKYYINEDIYLNAYHPSMAAQYYSKIIYFHKQKVRFDIWDTVGKENHDFLIRVFAENSGLIFIFYDSSDKASFERAKVLFNKIKEFCDVNKAIFVLISNKYDLYINSKNNLEKVSEEEALEFAINNKMLFAHISIAEKYGNGINELFDKVLIEYFRRKKMKV